MIRGFVVLLFLALCLYVLWKHVVGPFLQSLETVQLALTMPGV